MAVLFFFQLLYQHTFETILHADKINISDILGEPIFGWEVAFVLFSKTQFLKAYANHTMLTPPQRAAHLVMFKISIHLCRLRSENLNRMLQQ